MLRTCPGRPEVQKKPSCATRNTWRRQVFLVSPKLCDSLLQRMGGSHHLISQAGWNRCNLSMVHALPGVLRCARAPFVSSVPECVDVWCGRVCLGVAH